MRYLASECLQATNNPLMMSTFFAIDWEQNTYKFSRLIFCYQSQI